MRWPRLFGRGSGCPSDEATGSADEAHRALRDVDALTSRADEVADELSKKRERNHFGEAVAYVYRGSP